MARTQFKGAGRDWCPARASAVSCLDARMASSRSSAVPGLDCCWCRKALVLQRPRGSQPTHCGSVRVRLRSEDFGVGYARE